jgi:hypothetical protein
VGLWAAGARQRKSELRKLSLRGPSDLGASWSTSAFRSLVRERRTCAWLAGRARGLGGAAAVSRRAARTGSRRQRPWWLPDLMHLPLPVYGGRDCARRGMILGDRLAGDALCRGTSARDVASNLSSSGALDSLRRARGR